MGLPVMQMLITQMSRVAESMGWQVISTDVSGASIRIVLERPKPSPTGR